MWFIKMYEKSRICNIKKQREYYVLDIIINALKD